MNYTYSILIMSSFFSVPVFSSNASKQLKTHSSKEKFHLTPHEVHEKIKALPKNEQLIAIKMYTREYLARNINFNLTPDKIADQLNILFDNPLYKNLISIRIKSNINGTIQHVAYERCFLRGAKGEPNINRWIAPGYSAQK